MKTLKKRITPSILISSLALFIALGGASYAALGKNSVGSKQLKTNAVVTKKIKNDAVTASKIKAAAILTDKIKDDAVTGAKVKESSLGTVPEATHAAGAELATNATSATSAISADSAENLDGLQRLGVKRLTSSASNASFTAAQAAATEVPLFQLGTVTIYAKCFTVGSSLYAAHYVKTSVNGVIFDSAYDQAYGNPSFLDTGTPEDQREIFYTSAGMDSYGYTSNPEPTYIVTTAGQSYRANTYLFAKRGTLPGGDGPYGPGDACLFTGTAGLN
jgi:hypothetical protein